MSFYRSGEEIFHIFFKKRANLIHELEAGKLSKRQFLEENYNLVRRGSMSPFLRVDSYEMGMYNYQYYNVLAKYYNMLAKESQEFNRSIRYFKDYSNRANNYYNEKDKATLALLKYLDFQDMEAYYVDLNSKSLRGSLFEIVLLNHDLAVFHSKSKVLLDALKDRQVFSDQIRKSKIDEYINKTY